MSSIFAFGNGPFFHDSSTEWAAYFGLGRTSVRAQSLAFKGGLFCHCATPGMVDSDLGRRAADRRRGRAAWVLWKFFFFFFVKFILQVMYPSAVKVLRCLTTS